MAGEGEDGDVLFTLPTGYRPAYETIAAMGIDSTSIPFSGAVCYVYATGEIKPYTDSTKAALVYISLGGISFTVD